MIDKFYILNYTIFVSLIQLSGGLMMNIQVYLTSFHDIKRIHTFRCPLCSKTLGEGRIGILMKEGKDISGLVGKLVTCCNQQVGIPETFPDLNQADQALGQYIRALEKFGDDIKENPNADPPFIQVPASQMGITPERLHRGVPSSNTAQGN